MFVSKSKFTLIISSYLFFYFHIEPCITVVVFSSPFLTTNGYGSCGLTKKHWIELMYIV